MSIEKFSGTFSSEANGVTVLVNSVIQSIKDIGVLGLYTYLASKPDTWEPNAKEIMRHFNFSKDKVYRLINALIKERLMTMEEIRDKGKFSQYSYTIHLHRQPLPENQDTVINTDISPCPEKPDAENKETYIYKRVKNKEKEVRTPYASLLNSYGIHMPTDGTPPSDEIIQAGIKEIEAHGFTLERYLKFITTECSGWVTKPWTSKTGELRRNGYDVVLNPKNIRKAFKLQLLDK